jgi:hypothetical protein
MEDHSDTAAPIDTADAASGSQPSTTQTSRLDELIREKQAAELLAQRSIAEAAALRKAASAPSASEFAKPEDYTRAVAGHAVREAGADLFARQAAQAHEAAARAAEAAWAEATAAFRAKAPDFDQVAHNPNLPVTPVMADAIRESKKGAEIAYWLGKNPSEAARIAALPPVSQATAIARLESRVAGSPSAVSRAPEPLGPLKGSGSPGGRRLDDMDFEQYRRARGY